MPDFPVPAVYVGCDVPASVLVESSTFDEPSPPPPLFMPEPAVEGLSVKVVLGRAITREVIGCLESAEVDEWTEDVELLVTDTASITASSWDPLWSVAGDLIGISAEGTPVYEFDPKGYIVWIEVEGVSVWTGMFRSPVDVGAGRVSLPAVGPEAVFSERILGRAEQLDQLGGRGSFEDYSSVEDMEADGWVFPGGVTASVVVDGVRGTKALKVNGDGWVRSPRVTLMGAEGYGRTLEVSTFAKFNINIPVDAVTIKARAQRISDGAEDLAYKDENCGVRPDEESGWTDEPISAGGRMQPTVSAHRCWVDLKSFAGHDTYYDLVAIRQGVTTGAPPGSVQDLTWYVEKVLHDLNSTALGGSPTGLSFRLINPRGTTATGMRWAHNQRTKVADVLSMIFDRDDAPEAQITPGWWLEATDRLGSDRPDIAICAGDVIESGWSVDPSAQVDDFVADTGIGTGTSWISVTVSQDFEPDRHRIVAMVTAPIDRTLNEVAYWTQAKARAAARLHITKHAPVEWALASQTRKGDVVWVADHDGHLGLGRWMRVVNRRWQPGSLLCTLGLGETDG